jgi:hypothetical protein
VPLLFSSLAKLRAIPEEIDDVQPAAPLTAAPAVLDA